MIADIGNTKLQLMYQKVPAYQLNNLAIWFIDLYRAKSSETVNQNRSTSSKPPIAGRTKLAGPTYRTREVSALATNSPRAIGPTIAAMEH